MTIAPSKAYQTQITKVVYIGYSNTISDLKVLELLLTTGKVGFCTIRTVSDGHKYQEQVPDHVCSEHLKGDCFVNEAVIESYQRRFC